MNNYKSKIKNATKWSIITEIASKLIGPVTNMILARILAPEAFGMVATVTMIISFADIFTDAGFQKYLVQSEFTDEQNKDDIVNVAFWTNLAISFSLWVIIGLFRHQLASIVGNQGLGNAIIVACISLPLTSFSSIQTALFRREFDFKTIFYGRIIGICMPLIVTIPLALITKSYWALIIGTILTNLSNAILLSIRSSWKPKFYYSVDLLQKMVGFSVWTLTEQILGWANLNIGIFIVGTYLSSYYLGIYKTSMATVNQIMALVTSSLSPILLASLSRLKYKDEEYKDFYYRFEWLISILIIPLGIGIFIYRDLITLILLGKQWTIASDFVGMWALFRAIRIVFGIFSMEVFVSIGKPRYSVLSQGVELMVLIPVLMFSVQKGYNSLYVARSLVLIVFSFIEMFMLSYVAKISSIRIVKDTMPNLIAGLIMGLSGYFLRMISQNIIWQLTSIILCMSIYFGLLYLCSPYRSVLRNFINDFTKKLTNKNKKELV